MNFSAVIENHFRSIFKLSVLIGICSLIAFGSLEIYKARQESKSFIISQVREMAIADVNGQTLALLDGELNRIIKLWSLSEDFPFRVEVSIDGILWARGGQLHPFSWPFLKDESAELLPAGRVLKIEAQTYVGWALLRFGAILLVFGSFFTIVFAMLRGRIAGAVKEVTRPLEARVKKITEISENLINIKEVTLDMESNDINEVQAIDSSLKQLVGRIVTLEDGLAEAHFTQGRVEATEELAHTMKGTIASYQLALQSPTLHEKDKTEFESVLEEFKRISRDVLNAKKADKCGKNTSDSEGFSQMNAAEIIGNLVESNKEKIKKRNSKIRLQFFRSSDDPIILLGPSEAFERSVANILKNAIESFDGEGTITTTLKTSENFLNLEIQDNGRGIPKEVVPTLMSDGTTFGKKDGDGLGLYHARKVFERMSGSLNIFSKEGVGTVITANFPLRKTEKKSHEIAIFRGQTLIVVDDDPSIHKFFNKKLASLKDLIKVVSLTSPLDFKTWISENPNSEEARQFIFDFQFDGSSTTGIDLIEKYKLFHESLIISGVADKEEVVSGAARLKVRLIHKDNLDHINIKLEETEETYQQLIS